MGPLVAPGSGGRVKSRRFRRWQRQVRRHWQSWRRGRHALLVGMLGLLVVLASTYLARKTAQATFDASVWRSTKAAPKD